MEPLSQRRRGLTSLDLERGVGMLVTPAPVSLLIVLFELGKIAVFAMVSLGLDAFYALQRAAWLVSLR